MKKFFSVILLICLIFTEMSSAFAIDIDYSKLSDDELYTVISNAGKEATKRHIAGIDKVLIASVEGFDIYITEITEGTRYGSHTLIIKTIIDNKSKYEKFTLYNAILNGWDIIVNNYYPCLPGTKSKTDIYIYDYDEKTDISKVKELYEMVLDIKIGETKRMPTLKMLNGNIISKE